MLSINGFLVPHDAQICAHVAGPAFCHLAGFDTYELGRNDNFRPVDYVHSTSDAHDLLFHPLFEDSYEVPLECYGGRTLYEQLEKVEPSVNAVFVFQVTLIGQDDALARERLEALLPKLHTAYRAVFNMTECGALCPVGVF